MLNYLQKFINCIQLCIPLLALPNFLLAENAHQRLGHLLTLGTASASGTYWPVGKGICEIINQKRVESGIRCHALLTGGSVYNVQALRSGELDLAITRSELAEKAYAGISSFNEWGPFTELRIVLGLYDQPVSLVVKANSGIQKLIDLKGKRIGLAKPGSGQRRHVELILQAASLGSKDVILDSGLSAKAMGSKFCDGEIDVVIQAIAHPSKYYENLIKNCNARIVSMDGSDFERIKSFDQGAQKITLPESLYGLMADTINTYGYKAVLVTSSKVPDDVISHVIDILTENFEKYYQINDTLSAGGFRTFLTNDINVPVHNGAVSFNRALTEYLKANDAN